METDYALLALLRRLKELGYRFQAVTPATHARVLARPLKSAPTLHDIFGWNRPFAEADVDPDLFGLMKAAGILLRDLEGCRSGMRVASLGDDLFLHSAYPTESADSVFFGPDTYRFARFIEHHWPVTAVRHVVDLGAGSGAGGIIAARLEPTAAVTLVDINPRALQLARVNARAAGVEVEAREGREVPPGPDIVIANPPYMMDRKARSYRHGGELLGGAVALEWTKDALIKLSHGGTMLLYTGAAIVAGASPLLVELERTCREAGVTLEVEEIDTDVFGEELEQHSYSGVERIAAIGAVLRKP